MTIILSHSRRTDFSLILFLAIILSLGVGMLIGNRISNTTHQRIDEQRTMESRAAEAIKERRAALDSGSYRASEDTEAPARAKKARKNYFRDLE